MAKAAKKSSLIGDLAEAKTPLTLEKLKQEKEALDILTEVPEGKASQKAYTEKVYADTGGIHQRISLLLAAHYEESPAGDDYVASLISNLVCEIFSPKLIPLPEKVLKSTGTNGLAGILPPEAETYYQRLMEIAALERSLEMETLRLQNEIRRMTGSLAFGVLPSRLKAVCREIVHQPPKIVPGFKFRQFKWVNAPMVE